MRSHCTHILNCCGIVFQGESTKANEKQSWTAHEWAAYATKAGSGWIDHILETAGWKSEQTFSKFYKKPLKAHKHFAESVLDAAAK